MPLSLGDLRLGSHFFGLCFGLLDSTDVHERGFWEVIPFTITDFFERADRFFKRSEFTLLTSEYLGHVERL